MDIFLTLPLQRMNSDKNDSWPCPAHPTPPTTTTRHDNNMVMAFGGIRRFSNLLRSNDSTFQPKPSKQKRRTAAEAHEYAQMHSPGYRKRLQKSKHGRRIAKEGRKVRAAKRLRRKQRKQGLQEKKKQSVCGSSASFSSSSSPTDPHPRGNDATSIVKAVILGLSNLAAVVVAAAGKLFKSIMNHIYPRQQGDGDGDCGAVVTTLSSPTSAGNHASVVPMLTTAAPRSLASLKNDAVAAAAAAATNPLPNNIQILVRLPHGKHVTLDVKPSDTIEAIKVKIQEKVSVMKWRQPLPVSYCSNFKNALTHVCIFILLMMTLLLSGIHFLWGPLSSTLWQKATYPRNIATRLWYPARTHNANGPSYQRRCRCESQALNFRNLRRRLCPQESCFHG
jgi:hypothetical protein